MNEGLRPTDFLYEGALRHVAQWKAGRLEPRSAVPHSSQALCISVFGSLDGHSHSENILQAIALAAGIELPEGTPEIECEVRSHPEVLNEYGSSNPTSPDVLVRWPSTVMTVESKFREHLGGCSQVRPSRRKDRTLPAACSGDHALGSDMRTMTDAPCRLTIAEGRRTARLYWKVAERLFCPEILAVPRRPCPFASGQYQLMRNLAFADEYARREGFQGSRFLLAYVGGAKAARSTALELQRFNDSLLPEVANRVGSITYEAIARIVRDHGETKLEDWIAERIETGLRGEYGHE